MPARVFSCPEISPDGDDLMAVAGQSYSNDDQGDQGEVADFTPPRGFKAASAKLMKLMKAINIAEDMNGAELATIAAKVIDEYLIDKASRKDWEDRNDKAMKLAMQVADKKQYPWPNASNVKYPLLTTAAVQFAARAYPAIIQGSDVVKAKVVGSDEGVEVKDENGQPVVQTDEQGQPVVDEQGQPVPVWEVEPGAKRDKAERIARHMSWQLTEEMVDWEEDTDKLLHMLPIIGCVFRKTYFSRERGTNVSEMVPPMKLVVNNATRSLETVPRITQEFELYPHQITERVRGGLYLKREFGEPSAAGGDSDAEHPFLEQHRYLDLDEDDSPEPYIVTVHKETAQVVRIVANYDEQSVLFNDEGKVKVIGRIEYFTKYPFIPSPDGSFYDMGFGSLLGPIGESVNSTLNLMLDSGHLQNLGGGFIGKGARIGGGPIRFRPGTWKHVDSPGGKLRENIVPLPAPGPSDVLFKLLGLLIEAGKEISSVQDVMTGEAQGRNASPTTTLALIEQGMQVFTAIYKRVYRAEKREFKKLFRLNRRYLPQKSYFTVLDEPEAIAQSDYDDEGVDIVPVADPQAVSNMQKLGKAQLLMEFRDDPMVDGMEIRKRYFEQVGFEDVDSLLLKEPPPDAALMEMADKIDIEKRKLELKELELEIKGAKTRAEIIKLLAEAEAVEPGQQIEMYREWMRAEIEGAKIDSNERATAQAAQPAQA